MKRSIQHYRNHELVCEVECSNEGGWAYSVHVLGHDGDTDVLRHKESSTDRFASDIDALHAASVRARQLADAIADGQASAAS